VAAKIGYLAIDTVDPEGLAPFWCGLLGVQVDTTIGEGEFLLLSPTEEGLVVGFQRVPEAKAGKNRVHLDLVVDDLSWKDSSGVAWLILRATSSISTSCPPTLSISGATTTEGNER